MDYFLGVDVGGTKTHALIADGNGQALGFSSGGPGNWEDIGYDGLTRVILDGIGHAAKNANINVEEISGAGLGIGGFDWPSQRQAHLDAIHPVGLKCPLELVNDATLGILAGAKGGWGISVVSGTGCNCRGWSKDYKHEGRVVGGAGDWSGEAAGGFHIVMKAMQAVTFEWDKRGPATALTPAFLHAIGAKDLDDLVEGLYIGKYDLESINAQMVFKIAEQNDPAALNVVRWAGDQLGQMACGVVRQLNLEKELFEVVLIGSLFDGHPLMKETMGKTIHRLAPAASLVRLTVPPVVGGIVLGMQAAGMEAHLQRAKLIETTRLLLAQKNHT